MTIRVRMKRGSPSWVWVCLCLALWIVLAMQLAGCQAATTPTPTETLPPPTKTPTEPPPPTPTEVPDHSAFVSDWESGPHADNYALNKGPNTYCSRCHSPQNWDPTATTDRPPNCVTCKFPTDDEIRMATTMDFVEEEDWVGINCETCHSVESGVVQEGIAWLNVIDGEYESVSTPNELCGKCHANTQGIAVTGGSGVTHAIELGGSAHLNWAGEWPQADRPQYCSDCHNPHSTEPLDCVDCHENVTTSEEHMKGFNDEMLNKVTCMACHDASGMQVGPHPEEEMGGVFVTLVSEMSRSGETTSEYVKSHSIQWEVACDRCHFEENPWDLIVLTADGKPPEETE